MSKAKSGKKKNPHRRSGAPRSHRCTRCGGLHVRTDTELIAWHAKFPKELPCECEGCGCGRVVRELSRLGNYQVDDPAFQELLFALYMKERLDAYFGPS